MEEVKLIICVPTAEMARQAIFYDHFDLIDKPAGTQIMRPHGQSPARGRNMVIEEALKTDRTHILFIDDDTVPPTDIFTKLVAHNVDMVTGIYCMRNFPHNPIVFDYADSEGRCTTHYPEKYVQGQELVPLVATGLGACLIKTKVFEAMERPWITLGELEKDHWCDDISFFKRAREKGFKLWGDFSVRSGHFASCVVMPETNAEGEWIISYETGGTSKLHFPMIYPSPELQEERKRFIEEAASKLVGV